MNTELISTGITYGAGRNLINSAFSATAEFNNIILDSGANFSGGTGGGIIYSGNTDLYNVFSTTGGNILSASTGLYSIISNNNSNNVSSGNYSFSVGFNNKSYGISSCAIGGVSNISGTIGGINEDYSFVGGGSGNTANANSSAVIGGKDNEVIGDNSVIVGGSGNTINGDACIILGGSGNTVDGAISRSSILAGSGVNADSSNTAFAQRFHTDEYVDFEPLVALPDPSKGRMFFSGGSLNRLMYCSGDTANDWTII